MKNEALIHLKLEYSEALESKRDILEVQRSLVNSMSSLQKYRSLKSQEETKKQKLHRKFKESLTEIKKMIKSLPEFDRSESGKEEAIELKPKKSHSKKEEKHKEIKKESKTIEDQIAEIQQKLNSLQR